MIKNAFLTLLVLGLLLSLSKLYAQSLPINSFSLDEFYRTEQLLNKSNPNLSFVIRPLYAEALKEYDNLFNPTDGMKWGLSFNDSKKNEKFHYKILPIEFIQQYNSHHPEGINNGAMIPARGYQTSVSMGAYLEYGPLQIQIKPEYIYASNPSFDGFQNGYKDIVLESQYRGIDLPERIGDGSFSNLFWGQTSLRLNYKSFALGVSNQNLWWGPGIRNSLLMTNSAPGFKHLTFNTTEPINTPIGSFEGQIVAGKLEAYTRNIYLPNDWRYLNAMVISYQPKWVPGLFFGLIRSFTVYSEDMGKSLSDYLPVFIAIGKSKAGGSNEDTRGRDQLMSMFMRWVWPESNAEIYFEYGRNDHAWNNRDLIVQLPHSNAYVFGLTKLIPIESRSDNLLRLNFEMTQLAANPTTINRNGGSWYQHGQVIHGYTHESQLLGAGIGPGSNLQTLNISWIKSFKSIGFQFERHVHNNDFWLTYIKDYRANWVDLSAALKGNWNYKNLVFNVNLTFVKSFNYQWVYTPDEDEFWGGDKWDVFNFHGKVGIMYLF